MFTEFCAPPTAGGGGGGREGKTRGEKKESRFAAGTDTFTLFQLSRDATAPRRKATAERGRALLLLLLLLLLPLLLNLTPSLGKSYAKLSLFIATMANNSKHLSHSSKLIHSRHQNAVVVQTHSNVLQCSCNCELYRVFLVFQSG